MLTSPIDNGITNLEGGCYKFNLERPCVADLVLVCCEDMGPLEGGAQ